MNFKKLILLVTVFVLIVIGHSFFRISILVGNQTDGYIDRRVYRKMYVYKSMGEIHGSDFQLVNTIINSEYLEQIKDIFSRAKVYNVLEEACGLGGSGYIGVLYTIEAHGRFNRWRYTAHLSLCTYTNKALISFTNQHRRLGFRTSFLELSLSVEDTELLINIINKKIVS